MTIQSIKDNVFYYGSPDKERKLFDQLVPLPHGTSYNSYFVKGSEKTALIDTVYPPRIHELIEKLTETGIQKLDYIVCNHGEQDHSGALNVLLEKYPDVKILTNSKCKELIQEMLLVDESVFQVIADGETVSLGDKTLQFIMAPWVHWPDTMFTYIPEEKLLFTCDFLGSHFASDSLYVEDKEVIYESAKRYYAEIMMPFRAHAAKHLKKIKEMDVDMILPSHGPIYQEPSFILDAHEEWTSDNVKNEVVIPYVSMYESTKIMVEYLQKALEDRGVKVHLFDLIQTDIGELAITLVDAATLVIGSSMVLSGPHPAVAYGAYLINALRPKTKFVTIVGSYGWGGNMVGKLQEMIGGMKAEQLEPTVIKGKPKEADFKLLDNLADLIVEKHKSVNAL